MAKQPKKFISGAIQSPGSLTKQAKREGGITKQGKISKTWMKTKLNNPRTSETTKRRIRLAMTLGKF
jgi:hypothetical protein